MGPQCKPRLCLSSDWLAGWSGR
uniref:Uncharacterized protein n=1 Tax=Anguilla anguilla TaxID=7936 RepID=A0A0E9PQ65_ANGAN